MATCNAVPEFDAVAAAISATEQVTLRPDVSPLASVKDPPMPGVSAAEPKDSVARAA